MLLPSSIQRADDLVGMAMPTVALSWAEAVTPAAIVAAPATASARKVVFSFNMFHSLGCQTVFSCRRERWSCAASSLLCELDVRLRATARGGLQQEGVAGLRIGGTRRRIHVLPGRGDEETRQIRADKSGAARLLCRHAERAQALALRRVDVDTASAPAGVPDVSVGVAPRPVKTADAGVAQQHFRLAARQAGRGIERHRVEHRARSVGEVAGGAIGREAD